MPYYPDINVLFIHIPKTGGTNIENNITINTKQTLFSGETNTLLPFPYNNKSLQHQFYTTIYKYKNELDINFENIKIFSVVRNPYDRIISDLFWNKLIKINYSADEIFDVIKNNYLYRDDLDNHNIPQYKFITNEKLEIFPNIKIFKTETLNKDNEKINDFIGINFNIEINNVNKDYSIYLNKNSISLINDFYKKDFELLNIYYKFIYKNFFLLLINKMLFLHLIMFH
jgi:hypothetical protein